MTSHQHISMAMCTRKKRERMVVNVLVGVSILFSFFPLDFGFWVMKKKFSLQFQNGKKENFPNENLSLVTHQHSRYAQFSRNAYNYEHYEARLAQLSDKIHSKNSSSTCGSCKTWRTNGMECEDLTEARIALRLEIFTLSLSHYFSLFSTFPCNSNPHSSIHFSFHLNVMSIKFFWIHANERERWDICELTHQVYFSVPDYPHHSLFSALKSTLFLSLSHLAIALCSILS